MNRIPRVTWVLGSILLIEAYWVANTFRSHDVVWPIACMLGLIAVVRLASADLSIRRGHPEAGARPVATWMATALMTIGVIAVYLQRETRYQGEGASKLEFSADVIGHVGLLLCGMMFAALPRMGHPFMLPTSAMIALVTIAAGGISRSLNGQTAGALAFCVLYALGSQVIGPRCFSRRGLEGERGIEGSRGGTWDWLTALLLGLSLSAVMIIASTVVSATYSLLPEVQTVVHGQLKDTFETANSVLGSSRGQYVNGSRLGSVRNSLLNDSPGIALRVYSPSVPGYLRGNVFEVYEERRWSTLDSYGFERVLRRLSSSDPTQASGQVDAEFDAALRRAENVSIFDVESGGSVVRRDRYNTRAVDAVANATVPLASPGTGNRRRFPLNAQSQTQEKVATFEVHNDPMRGPVVFTSLHVVWVEAVARRLMVTTNDTIISGLDVRQPYVVAVSENAIRSPLEDERFKALTFVPKSIAEAADSVLQKIVRPEMSARIKAHEISDYFQTNYTYSLERVDARQSAEPVANFINVRHPAHCEYFATATAMLLRRAGVPTRYVTGYVVDEEDDNGVWRARNADAHAWVEAYDRETESWFAVESTPGRTYQTVTFSQSTSSGQSVLRDDDEAGDLGSNAIISMFRYWWALLLSNDPLMALFRQLPLPLLIMFASLLWYRRRALRQSVVDPTDVQSRRHLASVDRRLRRFGLARESTETLHQFAVRIESAEIEGLRGEPAAEIAEWYRDFASARYRGENTREFVMPINRRASGG